MTKDDWAEWMRHFSVELLAQSPSPALRACHSLAQVRTLGPAEQGVQPAERAAPFGPKRATASRPTPTGRHHSSLCLPPKLAQVHPMMARELFAAGFVSCWSELDPASQEQLVRSLEAALAAPTIPPEIVTALLNLAEFMEHDDKRLPLDTRTLVRAVFRAERVRGLGHFRGLGQPSWSMQPRVYAVQPPHPAGQHPSP